MQAELIHSMHEQVRAIYRALTGEDVGEGSAPEATDASDDTIARRFAELEVLARTVPSVGARVPPFMFTPAIDVIAGDEAVILELALPGIDRDDITIERSSGALMISGLRRDEQAARGNMFHAEIPRGPFCRIVPLPFAIEGEPRSELDRGVLRIFLSVATTKSQQPATEFHEDQQPTEQRRPGT